MKKIDPLLTIPAAFASAAPEYIACQAACVAEALAQKDWWRADPKDKAAMKTAREAWDKTQAALKNAVLDYEKACQAAVPGTWFVPEVYFRMPRGRTTLVNMSFNWTGCPKCGEQYPGLPERMRPMDGHICPRCGWVKGTSPFRTAPEAAA
jgi:hypothetical protein